jgi:hypothetical protein
MGLFCSVLLVAGCGEIIRPGGITDGVAGFTMRFRDGHLPGAIVTIRETGERAVSDHRGYFAIRSERRGPATLDISLPNHMRLQWPVVLGSGETGMLRLVTMADHSEARVDHMIYWSGTMRYSKKWISETITVRFENIPAGMQSMFWRGAAYWSQALGGLVSFVERPDGTVRVRITPTPCGDADRSSCARPSGIRWPDAVIYAREIDYRPDTAVDQYMMTHAIGKVLGLLPSPFSGDVMHLSATVRPVVPSNAEAALVCALYANPPGTRREAFAPPTWDRCTTRP